MQRFFKGAPIIWIVVLTEKAGLFFWYALLKSLYASWAGVPFSAVAGVASRQRQREKCYRGAARSEPQHLHDRGTTSS